jgi:hypothetical protein
VSRQHFIVFLMFYLVHSRRMITKKARISFNGRMQLKSVIFVRLSPESSKLRNAMAFVDELMRTTAKSCRSIICRPMN